MSESLQQKRRSFIDESENERETAWFLKYHSQPFILPDYKMPDKAVLARSLDRNEIRLVVEGQTVYQLIIRPEENGYHLNPWLTYDERYEEIGIFFGRRLLWAMVSEADIIIGEEEQRGDSSAFWKHRIQQAIDKENIWAYVYDDATRMRLTKSYEPLALWGQKKCNYLLSRNWYQ